MQKTLNMSIFGKLIWAVSFSFFSLQLMAQADLSTMMCKQLPQSALFNPANLPNYRFAVTLPSLYFGATSSSVSIQDIINNKNGSWINNLSANNSLGTDLNIETVGIYFGSKKLKFGIHHAIRSSGNIEYPKNLADLIWFGNSKFIGKTMELGPKIDFNSFHELGLAAAYNFGKLTIGGRVKYLSGIGNISTKNNQLSLFTSDDIYQLKLTSDFALNSSGTVNYYSIDSLTFDSKQLSFNKLFGKNSGLAFDLGANYDVTSKLQIGVGIHDLGGSINWKDNVQNLNSKGTFEYNGLELKNILYSDSTNNFDHVLDSVKKAFNLVQTNTSYKSSISTRYFATAQYKVSNSLSLNGILFFESLAAKTVTSFAIGGNYNLFSWLNIGANYAAKQNSAFNIGLNTTLKIGPVQIFALTDNILAIANPYNSRNASGRIGVNVLIGKLEN